MRRAAPSSGPQQTVSSAWRGLAQPPASSKARTSAGSDAVATSPAARDPPAAIRIGDGVAVRVSSRASSTV